MEIISESPRQLVFLAKIVVGHRLKFLEGLIGLFLRWSRRLDDFQRILGI
jgi:hypothetical protein